MESISSSALECECEINDRPVDFLGDSLCKSSPSNVRDIIKKYEPDRELVKQSGSLGLMSNQGSRSSMRPVNRLVFEESQVTAMQAVTQQHVTKPDFMRSFDKPRAVINNGSLGTLSKKSNIPSITKRSLSDVRPENPLSENTYQSKTTIIKTSEGVRITTDIHFNTSNGQAPDQWIGRRIDTDLPHSKILLEFESKNGNLAK